MGLSFLMSFALLMPAALQQRSDRISGLFPSVLQPLSKKFEKFQEKPLHISPFLALKYSRVVVRTKIPPEGPLPITV
jgi:hypothetical protein